MAGISGSSVSARENCNLPVSFHCEETTTTVQVGNYLNDGEIPYHEAGGQYECVYPVGTQQDGEGQDVPEVERRLVGVGLSVQLEGEPATVVAHAPKHVTVTNLVVGGDTISLDAGLDIRIDYLEGIPTGSIDLTAAGSGCPSSSSGRRPVRAW